MAILSVGAAGRGVFAYDEAVLPPMELVGEGSLGDAFVIQSGDEVRPQAPGGGGSVGDVSRFGATLDNRITRWHTTTAEIQSTVVTIDDSGNISGYGTLTGGSSSVQLTDAVGNLRLVAIEQDGAALNQAMVWNGSEWAPGGVMPVGGAIGGSGTVNTLPVFTAGQDIGDSQVTQHATNPEVYIAAGGAKFVVRGVESDIQLNGSAQDIAITIHNDNASFFQQGYISHTDDPTFQAMIAHARSRGVHDGQTIVLDNDILGCLSFLGFDGTDYHNAAIMGARIDGTPGNNDMPGELFWGVNVGGVDFTEFMTLNKSGELSVNPDADSTHVFGRTKIGTTASHLDHMVIAHFDRFGDTTYALRQNLAGQVNINTRLNQILGFRQSNVLVGQINATVGTWDFITDVEFSAGDVAVTLGDLDIAAGNLTVQGTITGSENQDSDNVIGRVRMGLASGGVADNAYIAHYDQFSSTNYAIRITPVGALNLNAASGQIISMGINNATRMSLSNTLFDIGVDVDFSAGDVTVTLGDFEVTAGGFGVGASPGSTNEVHVLLSSAGAQALFRKSIASSTVPVVKILQDSPSGAQPCVQFDQDDISEGFFDLAGSARGTGNTAATDIVDSARVEMNGVKRRVALYVDA